jgi:tyrosine-specific transport protein
LLSLSYGSIDKELLFHSSASHILAAIPVVVTSFGFHIVIPSLTNYLHKNVTVLKRVIFIGSFIPLVVYLLWEFITVGTISLDGPYGLLKTKELGQSATFSLSHLLNNSWVSSLAILFSFFAIVTSFLGVGLSLSHFLADGFKIHPNIRGRILTALLTYCPALFFVLFYPQGFIKALDYAGIFVALLLGILPCLMVLKGRKEHKGIVEYKVFGGNSLIYFVMVAYFIVIISVLI